MTEREPGGSRDPESPEARVAAAEQERDTLRNRLAVRVAPDNYSHSTACLIWNGDGGNSALPPGPCTCGALLNYREHELAEARAHLAERAGQLVAALEALTWIVELSAGWDEDGSTGPRAPLSWESVGRMAMDYARAALAAPPRAPHPPSGSHPGDRDDQPRSDA